MATATEVINTASGHLAAGRLDEAQRLFQAVLDQAPDVPAALNGLAMVALARKDAGRAVELLGHAVARDERSSRLYSNLAVAYRADGRAEEARVCFARAVELSPDDVAVRCNLVDALVLEGRIGEIAPHLMAALASDPASVRALTQVGAHAADAVDGERMFRRALAVDPSYGAAVTGLAMLHDAAGRADRALAIHRRAVAARPREAPLISALVTRLLAADHVDDAMAHCRILLALQPARPESHDLAARVFAALGRQDEARKHGDEATRLASKARPR